MGVCAFEEAITFSKLFWNDFGYKKKKKKTSTCKWGVTLEYIVSLGLVVGVKWEMCGGMGA